MEIEHVISYWLPHVNEPLQVRLIPKPCKMKTVISNLHVLLPPQMGTHSSLFDLIRICGQIIWDATADRIQSDTSHSHTLYYEVSKIPPGDKFQGSRMGLRFNSRPLTLPHGTPLEVLIFGGVFSIS